MSVPLRIARRRRGRRGQALVEFALLLPVLLMLILGLIDFARAWNVYQVVTDAAREGARMAVIDNGMTQGEAEDVVEAALSAAALDPSIATINFVGWGGLRGDPLSVQVEYPYTLQWIGALMQFSSGTNQLTLKSEITMRIE